MSPACACSAALTGAAGYVIEARAGLADGLAPMTLAGLPDTARDRIRAAINNSGEVWPQRAITAGLSPARLQQRPTPPSPWPSWRRQARCPPPPWAR